MIEFLRSRSVIPIPPTPLIGREETLDAALALLADPHVRLVSLIGPGGVGKTRLALELARALQDDQADGVCFVPLETIADPDLVPALIAHGLGVSAFGSRFREALLEAVRPRQQLLVLDNFEHLLAAAPLVIDLLAAGAGLKVLITSREALQLRGEHGLLVPPLALPEDGDGGRRTGDGSRKSEVGRRQDENGLSAAIAASPAVALFCQRARATRTAFTLSEENAADVAAICSRLDGLPLAIELAAARVSHLSPGAILERIDRQRSARFSLLTGGPRDAPPRLRTMHDAIAWSHDLLNDSERALFRRLAVFVGGFSLDAVEAISYQLSAISLENDGQTGVSSSNSSSSSALDLIAALVKKSLLRAEMMPGGAMRYGMLETIREFALEQLEASGEAHDVHQRHADWHLAFAIDAGEKTTGPDDEIWLQRLEVEHANLRAALTWFLEQGDLRGLMHLAAALTPFWENHAHYREGRRWLEAALTLDGDSPPGRETPPPSGGGSGGGQPGGGTVPRNVRLRALTGAGTMAWYEGDHAQAIRWHEQALVLARDTGDRLAEASALNNLGVQAMDLADNDRATVYFEASLAVARAASDPRATFFALHNLAQVARLRRQGAAAAARTEEALALAREFGEASIMASALSAFGHAMLDVGDVRRAAASFGESLDLAHSRGNFGDVIDAWEGLACLGAENGLAEEAARLFGAAAALRDAVGVPYAPADTAYFEPALQAARRALGQDRFAAETAAGRKLSPQEAMTEAVSLATMALPSAELPRDDPRLTPREREVLRLLVEGFSDKEIGAALTISAQTVTKHVGNLLRKLDVPSRTAAATFALRRGLT